MVPEKEDLPSTSQFLPNKKDRIASASVFRSSKKRGSIEHYCELAERCVHACVQHSMCACMCAASTPCMHACVHACVQHCMCAARTPQCIYTCIHHCVVTGRPAVRKVLSTMNSEAQQIMRHYVSKTVVHKVCIYS